MFCFFMPEECLRVYRGRYAKATHDVKAVARCNTWPPRPPSFHPLDGSEYDPER